MERVFAQDPLLDNASDSVSLANDSLKSSENLDDIILSPDAFSSSAKYGADHKTYFHPQKNLVYLYGNAFVEYEQFSIRNADYIEVDLKKNIATARLLPDSMKFLIGNTVYDTVATIVEDTTTIPEEDVLPFEDELIDGVQIDPITGEPIEPGRENREAPPVDGGGGLPGHKPGTPLFSDGTNEFDANEMRYNFKTGKGKVYNAVTFQSNLYIHGTETKFIESQDPKDTIQTIYNKNAIFTTCNAPVPHFGIWSNKQKIVPNKEVIVGPSNLQIMGIPTPLVLPFGFYPIVSTAKEGLIVPSYEYSQQWGFGLRGIGWYQPISEHMNLTARGDIYFNGSWLVDVQSNYRKRYKFNGGFSVSFSNRIQELASSLEKQKNRSFALRWNHSQDRSAHPYQNFSASVNFTTSGFDKLNYNQANQVLNNNTSSQISYRREFPGTPFSMTSNISHSQNSNNRSVSFTLPSFDLRMRSLQPFKKKKSVGDEQWYEKILLTYSGSFDNKIQTTDTTIFQPELWKSQKYGAQHQVGLNASYRLLKYISVTPSVNLNERWYFDKVKRNFVSDPVIEYDTVRTVDNQLIITRDTVSYGMVEKDTTNGFFPVHDIGASLNFQTALYYTKLSSKGWFRGFRHVAKPSVSLSFKPDYANSPWNYTDTLNRIDRGPDYIERYSFFEEGIYGAPSTSQGNFNVSYSLRNVLEAKLWNRPDSTAKKISLFKTFDFSGNYNPKADSLNFSMINFNANTTLFKGISYFRFSTQLDPYAVDERNRRIDKFYYKTGAGLFRFNGLRASLSTNMTVGKIRELLQKPEPDASSDDKQSKIARSEGLFDNFRVSHEIRFVWDPSRDKDVFQLSTNNIRMSGNVDLTEHWGVRVGNFGYDFQRKQLTYPDFGFTRDLHCWQLSFSWQPTRGTFLFNIRVKNAPLDFIDLPYNRGIQDSGYSPF